MQFIDEHHLVSDDEFQELRIYVEQHMPWLEVLGIVGKEPLLAVKDTATCNLCVGFRTKADLAAYLTRIGKESLHVQ